MENLVIVHADMSKIVAYKVLRRDRREWLKTKFKSTEFYILR